LSKAEVLELVSGRVPRKVIAEVVKRYGISFEPTEEVLNEFRKAGVHDVVITAMRASWHPECPKPLSDKDVLVLAEHMPSEKIVNLVQRCGIGFQPTDEYLQGLRSSEAKDELIDALRTSATKPFSRAQTREEGAC
jgi:adenosine deaminase